MMKLLASKRNNILAPIIFIGASIFSTFGQTSPDILAQYKAKFPEDNVVQLKDSKVVTIKYVKNKPQIVYHIESEELILNGKGALGMNEEEIHFSSLEYVSNIQAYTLVPNGSKFKKVVSQSNYTRDAESDGMVFHDDGRVTTVVFSNIQEGAIRHLSYDVTMTQDHFPFSFYFFNYYPGENATFQIISDTSFHVKTMEYHLDKIGVTKSETIDKKTRTITYTAEKSLRLKIEDNAPSLRYYGPHVNAQLAYYHSKTEGRVQVIETIEDLHRSYYKNIKDVVDEIPSEEIKETTDSIIKNCTSEFDKVKAIYYWVQNNLKYVAFEEGMSGFIPRQPSRVIEKRFGDCKDMASLIYSFMKVAGIKGYLTWIGSRDLPYKYTDFPSTFCDNHMICTYQDENGKWWFLDATNSFQSIDAPTSFIQGKQALVNKSETEFEIIEVPIMPANYTTVYDTSWIKINDRSLIGKSTNKLTGYYHSMLGNMYRDVSLKEINKFMTAINERGNNSFNVTNSSYLHSKERDSAGILNFDWTVTNYCTKVDNEFYINLIIDKELNQQGMIKDDRVAPVELENMSSDTYCVILEIPEGYTVKYQPSDVAFNSDVVDLTINYKKDGSNLIMTLQLNLKYLLLQPAQFETWNNFTQIKKKALSESVILIKK